MTQRQADREKAKEKETDRQTDGQAGRQAGRQADRQTPLTFSNTCVRRGHISHNRLLGDFIVLFHVLLVFILLSVSSIMFDDHHPPLMSFSDAAGQHIHRIALPSQRLAFSYRLPVVFIPAPAVAWVLP